ncbi:MAG TPA: MFS transporter [Polyangia bacterium]
MLKLFYVCIFVVTGTSTPFFAPYLRKLGLSGQQVSAMLMVAPTLQLVVPLLWGWLADRTRQPHRVLQALCLGAFAASLPIIFVRTMPALLLLFVAQQFFYVCISPLADSLAVEKARMGGDYSRIRLWGSLSFITVSMLMGLCLDWRGVKTGDVLVPAVISVGLALSLFAGLGLKGRGVEPSPHLREVRQLLHDRRFRFLLVVAGLHWMCLVPYHGFFGILLQDRGFPARIISYSFVAGAGAEIMVFLAYSRLRARIGLLPMFAAVFAVSALRWWFFAYAQSAWLIVVTQLLHALTFGLFWVTCMAWIGGCVPPRLRATGQVLFSTTLGVGSMVGLLATGALYDATGGAGIAFTLAGLLELLPLAWVLIMRGKLQPVAIKNARPEPRLRPG